MKYILVLWTVLFSLQTKAGVTFDIRKHLLLVKDLNVLDFGALGNGIHDDSLAIQNAIDSATQTGSKVVIPEGIYNISTTIIVKAGVMIQGQGRGSTATNTPYNGTIIKNTSTNQTIRIIGQNAGIRDLVIYDTDNAGAAGGIEILADNAIVESVVLKNLLLFGFTDGVALKLDAKNGGGISYCSFYDIRIRHAKTGILIQQDETSFVNSNSFFHGSVSGGGFDYCLRVLGGNNNIFNALILEPYASIYGHLVVEKGEIIGHDIRIEGTQQAVTVPLVEFKSNTINSTITGIYSGGLTRDLGDNYIDLKSGKSLDFKNSSENLFVNASFNGVVNNTIPYWEIPGSGVTVEVQNSEILTDHYVLKVTIPAGLDTYLRPKPEYLPAISSPVKYDQVNFGAYIKTNKTNTITTICKSPGGVTTGLYHLGNSAWQMIGMTSKVDRTTSYNPKFYITNSSSSTAAEIYITTPTLNFGLSDIELESKPISSSGGIVSGTLTTSMTTISTQSSGFLALPKDGNVFEVNGTNTTSRINYSTNKFPSGTIITLLFNDSNASVTNSAYIKLTKSFSAIANGSLTLLSMGDGTWRELNRNN
jgi:hypothetical protein